MKTKVFFSLLLVVALFSSCKYDDAALWDKVNSLDNRLNNIEEQLTGMNSEIQTMSSLVNALQGYVYVSGVSEVEDGYVIKFSDGKTATISNGKDGQDGKDGKDGKDGQDGKDGANAPVIGFDKDTDGNYYWTQTIDGVQTWLTDAYGAKVPVTGESGKTPLLKVNANGYWMVSYDNGLTYMQVLDANGNPVKAVGEDGEDGYSSTSWFDNVTYDSTTGVLTLVINGETVTLSVGAAFSDVPSDAQAGTPPVVNESDKTFEMPNSISTISKDPNNANVGRFSLAGINANGEWLELYGTGEANQNVWVEINGVQKGIKVVNGEQVAGRALSGWVSKAKADVVFLVDNSGSMSEEADKVAEEIKRWAEKLANTMDVQFGCVGIDHYYVNGALNITDVNTLHAYLNEYTGYNRTKHYGETMDNVPADASVLKSKAQNYRNAGGECGGIMLHFANENFEFREGANRFYVYFTDEPNQPGNVEGYPWSVKTVDTESSYYNWSASKGVIYTVYSGLDLGGDPHGWTVWNYKEDPTLFSTYTGGQIIETNGDFNISLDELPVTGAILQSFIISFNITPDLKVGGSYDVTIIIKSPDGKIVSKYTYKNIEFV